MKKVNVNQIVSAKRCVDELHYRFSYFENKLKWKFLFWSSYYEDGFYYFNDYGINSHNKLMTIDEIESTGRLICVGREVYFKPHLDILMSSGVHLEKFFDTVDELDELIESEEMKSVVWIDI